MWHLFICYHTSNIIPYISFLFFFSSIQFIHRVTAKPVTWQADSKKKRQLLRLRDRNFRFSELKVT